MARTCQTLEFLYRKFHLSNDPMPETSKRYHLSELLSNSREIISNKKKSLFIKYPVENIEVFLPSQYLF